MIDALDATTFAIMETALESVPAQEVASVKTKECTKEGPLITYVQQIDIKVLCGVKGCAAKAEELERNPPATFISEVINAAIEDGSFGSTLEEQAKECKGDCGALAEVTAEPVKVVAGPLVLNTLSPSISPTSPSPTVSPSSSSTNVPTNSQSKSPVINAPTDSPLTSTTSSSPTSSRPTVSPSSSSTTKSVSCC